jgi:hypothetical protein
VAHIKYQRTFPISIYNILSSMVFAFYLCIGLQHRREVAGLLQDKKHLSAVLKRVQEDLSEVEAGQGRELMLLQEGGVGQGVGEEELMANFGLDFLGGGGGDDDDEGEGEKGMGGMMVDLELDGKGKQKGEGEGVGGANRSPLQLRLGKNLSVDTSTEKLPALHSNNNNSNNDGNNKNNITKEELLSKNEQMTADLLSCQRDLSGYRRQCEQVQSRLKGAQEGLEERDDIIRYYERLATAENLPLIQPGGGMGGMDGLHVDSRGGRKGGNGNGNGATGSEFRMLREEQEQLQEAASATIGSMRSLLEEKNREIERLRSKLERHQRGGNGGNGGNGGRSGSGSGSGGRGQGRGGGLSSSHVPSVADRRAEELLEKLADEERYQSHVRGREGARGGGGGEEDAGLVQRLMDQIDRADEILQDKMKLQGRLELQVATLQREREKAEQRCGASLEEMESMKLDMTTLVKQLKDSEDKYLKIAQYNQLLANGGAAGAGGGDMGTAASTAAAAAIITDMRKRRGDDDDDDEGGGHIMVMQQLQVQVLALKRKVSEVSGVAKNKEEKLKQYRRIIIGLKEEFIKSEEEKAVFEAKSATNNNTASAAANANANMPGEMEMETLRDQVCGYVDG